MRVDRRRARGRLRRRRARRRRCAIARRSRPSASCAATIARRSPAADPSTRTVHFEIDLPDPDRAHPGRHHRRARASTSASRQPATEIPLVAAVRARRQGDASSSSTASVAHKTRRTPCSGERGGSLFVEPSLAPGSRVVTEGRALLDDGDRVEAKLEASPAATPAQPARDASRDRALAAQPDRDPDGLHRAGGVRGGGHAAHERRHLPRADAAGAGRRHAGAGPRPEGRREDASPGASRSTSARRRASTTSRASSRNNLSRRLRLAQVGHRPQLGADAGAAAGRVRDVGGARSRSACCRRSCCSTIRRTRRWSRSRSPAAGSPGPQLYDYALNNIEPVLEGIPGVASASINGGRQRQINVVVDPVQAQARGVTSTRRRRGGRAVERAPAVGRVHLAEVRRQRLHQRGRRGACATSATPPSRSHDGHAGAHPRRRARRGRRLARRRRRSPSTARTPSTSTCCASPAATRSRSSTRSRRRSRASRTCRPGLRGQGRSSISRRSCAPRYHGLKKEIVQALVLIALVILLFLQSVRGTLIVVGRDPALVRDHADRPLRDGPDAERVHARRPDAGDGAPRRRRGRRARVDPPPPAHGHERAARRRSRAPTRSRCRCSPRR